MNTLEQDHIVRFLTAFQRREKGHLLHYVIFEWADGGDLSDFWQEIARPELSPSMVLWAITQLHGLAGAMNAARSLKFHHASSVMRSDVHARIRPDKLLWFRHQGGELGTLKFSDWVEVKKIEKSNVQDYITGRSR
jgi:serine/threonine protein kinase